MKSLIVLLALSCLQPCPAFGATPYLGTWAGVVESGASFYFVVNVTRNVDGRVSGDITFPRESESSSALRAASIDGTSLSFDGVHNDQPIHVSASVSGGKAQGIVLTGGKSFAVKLFELRGEPRAQLLLFTGDFADRRGRAVVVSESLGRLYYFDRETGRTGRLYPLGKTQFFGGPTLLIHLPIAVTATFSVFASGIPQQLVLELDGTRLNLSRVHISQDRTINFTLPGAKIVGTIRRPIGRGALPAVLLLAGSNGQPRSGFYAAESFVEDQFVRLGFVTMTFDKRGVGDSTGQSGDNGAEDVAAAALSFLMSQPEVDRTRVGLWGESEGGIIAPKVAALVPSVRFIINTSGSIVDANTQEIQRTERQLRADGFSEPDIANAVALQRLKFHYAQTGSGWEEYIAAYNRFKNERWFPDPYVGPPSAKSSSAWQFWRETGGMHPADYWKNFRNPTLVIYGEHEELGDSAENATLFLAAMRTAGNESYSVVRIPDADHSMFVSKSGGLRNARLVKCYSLPYYDLLGEWLHLYNLSPANANAAALGSEQPSTCMPAA